jgi:hypothetical protein
MAHTDDIKRLFLDAAELPAGERAAWLDEHCADPAIRAEVDELLVHHEQDTEFLRSPVPSESGGALVTSLGPGDLVDDMEILDRLGQGGMGVVYLAREPLLDRQVAVKMLPASGEAHPGDGERMRTEARALSRLDHPAVVPVYRTGDVDGRPFLVMPYVEGQTLAELLAAERTARRSVHGGGNGAERERVEGHVGRVARVAEALDHAHQHDVIHRDVKPSNILLDTDGAPHLTDFGIARLVDLTGLTRTGHVAGSCRYMSPEQARATGNVVDARTDVFSLGVVLYEALTLEVPFDGPSVPQILRAVMEREPRRVRGLDPSLPVDLETICHKALEKRPEDRYQSAGHLAADLRTFLAGGPILARPPSLARRASRWVARHRLPVVSTLLVAATLVLVAVLSSGAHERSLSRFGAVVTSRPVAGEVFVQRLDPEARQFGAPSAHGATPVELALDPGQYRITVIADDGRFAETTWRPLLSGDDEQAGRRPGELAPAPLDLLLLAPGLELPGFVAIPAAEHRLGREDLEEQGRALRRAALPAFAVATDEVSNAEFRAFVAATDAAPPEWWPEPWDPALDRLPVVGVSYLQAEAFARWHGLRVPTSDEWEAAARWPDGWLLPWGEGPAPVDLVTPPVVSRDRLGDLWTVYAQSVGPVDGADQLASTTGMRHTATNVSEYTSTLDLPGSGAALVRGGDWRPELADTDLTFVWHQKPGTGSPFTGFRCARSAAPLIDLERND